jgi:hypothetical protein
MQNITADTQIPIVAHVKEDWSKPQITILGVKNETLGFDNIQTDHNNSGSYSS